MQFKELAGLYGHPNQYQIQFQAKPVEPAGPIRF